MSDVEQVLRDYIREHRAGGEADPREFLDRVDERGEKLELEALIDAYLEHAPRADVLFGVAPAPAAEAVVDRIEQALDQPVQTWRALLPSLRMHARLKRSELVSRLAAALGVTGREDKVARYYNAMEHEQLDPDEISPRVFDALAALVHTTTDALRNAAPRPAPPPTASVLYARLAPWDADEDAVAASPAQAPELEWDEVDELFRGG
jgi:hypothetical protein